MLTLKYKDEIELSTKEKGDLYKKIKRTEAATSKLSSLPLQ